MTRNRALFFILYRYLILSWASKKKHRNGSSVSVLIPIYGVAIGVFAFIVVIGIMSGFVQNIKYSILHFEPHIVLMPLSDEQITAPNNHLIAQIKSLDSRILSVSPFQKSDVILQAGSKAVIANLHGINPSAPEQPLDLKNLLNNPSDLLILNKKMPAQSIKHSILFPTIILDSSLMNQLHVTIGDNVTLVSPTAEEGPGGMAPTQFPVVIAGHLNGSGFAFDKKIILSSLETANLFLQNYNSWQGCYLILQDPMAADEVAQKIKKNLANLNLKAVPWTQNNKSLLKALSLEHYGMIFVLIMIILVGCFSIAISLLLSLRRKAKEMAILRSMGLRQIDLFKIYLWQGFFIGSMGALLGLASGFSTLHLVHHYTIPFITTSYSAEPLPILINWSDVLVVTFGSLLLSMVAAIWPAYETKKLNVVDVLSLRG